MLLLIYLILGLHISYGMNETIHVEGTKAIQNAQSIVNSTKQQLGNITNSLPLDKSVDISLKFPHPPDNDLLQSGALLRAFYVVLGVTIILLSYIGFRMFRLRKGTKPPVMVKKYGILTNRSDVEMVPLPLSEDEDDDTIFEINNVNNR
ncbi:PREDICTED: uncharacterized protein LOC108562478 [Nicrophorus vespilloides]|uniref:Uncharacterized protein LOC108562478 n=1 Tax=Nicrophorus vespilloides TaxID=110193 RepID=A0ABM1MP27_NICVS|nr:PREDICTED: uncharacterized protein LOC108562478 [Nicrophorus vespilloides]